MERGLQNHRFGDLMRGGAGGRGDLGGCPLNRLYEGMSLRETTEFLFVEDSPAPADCIFVFGGKHPARALRAAGLYLEGYAPRMLITGGDSRVLGRPEADALAEIAVAEGVPPEAILTERRSANTVENVLFGRAALEQAGLLPGMRRMLIVSAPWHMCRARLAVRRHFPSTVEVLACPDGRPEINRDNWTLTAEGRQQVFRELEKVRTYLLKGDG